MNGGVVFLSYSREQLYFAESLCLQLQKAGISVWMDLQKLEPGGDWREQIHMALHGCSALVLVASRAALRSSYVQQEWQAVLNGGKRIYIVLYEEVNLPPELASASLVDFRGSFKRGVRTLANALMQDRAVHEPTPKPGWTNLPQRLPPAIQLVARMLVIEAIITPFFFQIIRFPMFLPIVWFINSLLGSATLLWMWWKLLHHRYVHSSGLAALSLPYFYYCFYVFSQFFKEGMSDDLLPYKWVGLIVFGWVLIGLIYLLFGAEFLRWSNLREEAEAQAMRRWFNKARRGKRNPAFAPDLRNALSARGTTGAVGSATEGPSQRMDRILPQVRAEADTYSLHYAPADRPVASSLHRAFAKQKLREVDSSADAHVVILSDYLPHAELERLLNSQSRVIAVLAGNINVHGDALLERITQLQLVDYRDRSAKILPALAKTLKDVSAPSLQIGLEITPKSFHETVLPLGTYQMGLWVSSMGVYLLLSGFVASMLGFMNLLPMTTPLDLIGLLIGPVLIRQGAAFSRRRTTNWIFFPILGFSIWLGISIVALAFYLFSWNLPANPLLWILIPSKALALNESLPLICFLPFTFFLVPFMLFEYFVRYKNWLPASTRRANDQACLQPLPDKEANRWALKGWLVGAFLVFVLPLAMYLAYFLLFRMIQFPFQ